MEGSTYGKFPDLLDQDSGEKGNGFRENTVIMEYDTFL